MTAGIRHDGGIRVAYLQGYDKLIWQPSLDLRKRTQQASRAESSMLANSHAGVLIEGVFERSSVTLARRAMGGSMAIRRTNRCSREGRCSCTFSPGPPLSHGTSNAHN